MPEPVQVKIEQTPNPNTMKFTLNRVVAEGGSVSYDSPQEAEGSPLAKKLFEVKGVKSLFLLQNFITVARDPSANWHDVVPQVKKVIEEQLSASSD